jgi:hypothetical protein
MQDDRRSTKYDIASGIDTLERSLTGLFIDDEVSPSINLDPVVVP